MSWHALYGDSLALLTDLYQLTMAQGYWQVGLADRESVFHLSFRNCPFRGQYALACGLKPAAEFLSSFHFAADDLRYLATLQGSGQRPLFHERFLEYLGELRLRCDVDAVPEGTVVFPRQPLVRVRGPLLQAQLLETPLLTLVNFSTLVATKAARICREAVGQLVLEFGLRRAQGLDGGVTASRAAFIGGCSATSNVLAGKLFGIPVKGTHAHSWVMAFESEAAAFAAYAEAMPHNCIFLVDTYDTLQGVRAALHVAQRLREQGHELLGIRLDSGQLDQLSRESRRLLDEAGFPDAVVVASGDLDEFRIRELNRHGATVGVWGVGTRLATAYDDPALGGIYKLAALRDPRGVWQYKLKLSEQRQKTTDPGILQVRRYQLGGQAWGDVVYDEPTGIESAGRLLGWDGFELGGVPPDATGEDLLRPVFRGGELVAALPAEDQARQYAAQQLAAFDDSLLRLDQPQAYRVGLEPRLYELKQRLMRTLC
ncbi:MAG: nicotinate phosphoribosyltransferase [Pirellulaceae bacterium]|nr:nicotinate phosphoribosyltransferase [Pirellulaceae bacterium]